MGSISSAPTSEPAFELDTSRSSTFPLRSSSREERHIIIESAQVQGGVTLSGDGPKTNEGLLLTGTALVRNVSFQKSVVVRFTLDDWATVSEVGASWTAHLDTLPASLVLPPSESITLGDLLVRREIEESAKDGWDRFTFNIKLGDYTSSLVNRTVFMVAKYQAGGVGEWWDNNAGTNYTVRFKGSPVPRPGKFGSATLESST